MVESSMVRDHDMGESSMVRDHDMGESLMVRDHDMGESSMVRDDQVDNQIVVLPKDLQHPDDSREFHSTPNGTPYWVPDVPKDEKPKKGLFIDSYSDAYETYLVYSQKARFNIRKGPTRALRLKAGLVGGYDKVVLNKMNGSVTCSCGHYNRHGFLCRHVFCVFSIYGIYKIADVLNRRWTKNVLPTHLLDKRHRYGPCIEEIDTLASQVHQTIEECIGLFMNATDKLFELLSTIKDLKKKLENEMQTPHVALNKDALYSDLLDDIVFDKVVIKTPKSIFRSKGTRRIKSAAEKSKAKAIARSNRKVSLKRRTCSACGGKGLNKATCEGCNACGEPGHHKGICKKFSNQDKGGGSGKNVVVDDEDEGDTDDQFDDEALGATEDEFDEDDEDDEEYESDEE
nr:FAR1 DNA binding domain-containing protein [Tanacetum cinerariifolium]